MSGKPAARVSDPTACPISGHGTNPIAAGSGDVFFDGPRPPAKVMPRRVVVRCRTGWRRRF